MISEVQKIRIKGAEVVIRKIVKDQGHKRDTVRIAAGVVEEKSWETKVKKSDRIETGAMKGEIWAGVERDADTGVEVKTETKINICEVEVEAEKGS